MPKVESPEKRSVIRRIRSRFYQLLREGYEVQKASILASETFESATDTVKSAAGTARKASDTVQSARSEGPQMARDTFKYVVKHAGRGRWNVVSEDNGEAVNEEPLSKQDADNMADDMSGGKDANG